MNNKRKKIEKDNKNNNDQKVTEFKRLKLYEKKEELKEKISYFIRLKEAVSETTAILKRLLLAERNDDALVAINPTPELVKQHIEQYEYLYNTLIKKELYLRVVDKCVNTFKRELHNEHKCLIKDFF